MDYDEHEASLESDFLQARADEETEPDTSLESETVERYNELNP